MLLRTSLAIAVAVLCAVITATPAVADLDSAKHFAIVSWSGPIAFGNFDEVYKVTDPMAGTCPAGTRCPAFSGGTNVTRGTHDKILTKITMDVGPGGASAEAYSKYLAHLAPTMQLKPIVLAPGATVPLKLHAGYNVLTTPSIRLGMAASATLFPQRRDPCANSTGQGALLVVDGTSSDTLVINVGRAEAPGSLLLCGGSKIALRGGITPDRIVVNVLGKGTIALGDGSVFAGTMLAPKQAVVVESGASPNNPTTVDGSVLVGVGATFGDNVIVRFWPLQELGAPANITLLGKVDTNQLPRPIPQKTTTQAEDNPPQPRRLPVAFRQNEKTLMPTTPSLNGNVKRGLKRPHLTSVLNYSGLSQNGKTPSDVQFAAGMNELIEMVNDNGAFYTNPGGTLINSVDLGQFFLGNAGQGTDPRIYYDAATHNFIAVYEMHPAGGDDIRLGIASDPGNSWTIYEVAVNNAGATYDQPKLGVGTDKVIVSWNNYGTEHGTSYIVIQKAALVARASAVPAWIWKDDTSRFQVVPANSLSPDQGTQYGGWRCCGNSTFDLMAFTGVPGISPVNFTDNSYGIGSVTGPPPGQQPAGGDPTIATNDDRLLSTVWQNGNLWGSFNEGCRPQNDRTQRACERFVQVGTPGGGVHQNVQLQWAGNDIYYSAVTLDAGGALTAGGNLFFGVTFSSSTQDPTAMVLGVPGASFTPSTPALIELAGSTPFAACAPPPPPDPYYPCSRWGDYSAAARDPINPNNVWIVNQYGGLRSPAGFWGTSITEMHI